MGVIYRADYLYEYQGQSLTLSEWADFLATPVPTLRHRVKRYGFSEAVTMPSPDWRAPKRLRIDPCDLPRFRHHNWSLKDGGIYRHQIVTGQGKTRAMTTIYLHREIMGVTGDQSQMIRFTNGDKCDCRRGNLEIVPMSEHVRTAMKGAGCSYRTTKRRWESYITYRGKTYYLKSSKDRNVVLAAYQHAIDRINRGLHPKP